MSSWRDSISGSLSKSLSSLSDILSTKSWSYPISISSEIDFLVRCAQNGTVSRDFACGAIRNSSGAIASTLTCDVSLVIRRSPLYRPISSCSISSISTLSWASTMSSSSSVRFSTYSSVLSSCIHQ